MGVDGAVCVHSFSIAVQRTANNCCGDRDLQRQVFEILVYACLYACLGIA